MWVDPETLRAIFDYINKRAVEVVAPFTRGGKLDLSSPNIVGHLPPGRGGTGGTTGALEYLFWDGEIVVWDGDGVQVGA